MCNEVNTIKFSGKDIYLEKRQFLEKCKKLNVSVSYLEIYEEFDLLYPIYRIIKPKEYMQVIFEQNHVPNPENVRKVPDQYDELLKFENKELSRWHIPTFQEFEKALIDGHPLDQAFERSASFIQKPSKDNFKKWKYYEIKLEITPRNRPLRHTDSIAVNYYSPWQIYLLEEANRKHNYENNILYDVPQNDIPKKTRKLDTIEYQIYFETLWEYKFKETLLLMKYSNNIKKSIIEGEEYKKLYNDQKDVAIKLVSSRLYKEWIIFLKYCCSLFFDYQRREKQSLSKCIKRDIRSVIDLILYGTDKKYNQLIEDVGMNVDGATSIEVPPLEIIFPEYENKLKRDAKPLLESVLNSYNSELPENFHLNIESIDEIMDYAFNIGNETLLVSVVGLNKEYYSPTYFRNECIWSYVRSLAVSVESWVKIFTDKENFHNALNDLSANDFGSCKETLSNNCGNNKLRIFNINDLKNYLNELSQINLIINGNDLCWMKFLIRSYLIRNYVAHYTKLEPNIFGDTLIQLYRSLLYLVFFTWKKKHVDENDYAG
jgi:hypothetical protein